MSQTPEGHKDASGSGVTHSAFLRFESVS